MPSTIAISSSRPKAERSVAPQAEWLAIYGRHIDNVRAGLDWAFSAARRPADRRGADRCRCAAMGAALAVGRVPRAGRTRAGQPWRRARPTTARSRMQLSAALGWSLMYGVGRAQQTGAAWATTLELAEELDDTDYRRRALWGLCIDQFNNGNVRTALGFARRFAESGSRFHRRDRIDDGRSDPGHGAALPRRSENARHHIDRALAHDCSRDMASRKIVRVPGSICGCRRTISRRASFGCRDMRTRHCAWSSATSRRRTAVGQALSFCSVLGQGACPIAFWAGDLDAAARYGTMLLDHTERHPVRLWNIWARCFIGLVTAATRRRRRRAAGSARRARAGGRGQVPAALPVSARRAGATPRRARRDRAGAGKAWNSCWHAAKLAMNAGTCRSFSRIKAELILSQRDQDTFGEIEALFLSSLEEARRQDALSWELRTALSLARCWKDRRRGVEAGALLKSVHDRFTEGFATPDLRLANTLLEGLS